MRLLAIVIVILLCADAQAFEYWNDIRHSALLPDTTVEVRVENISGTGIENYALFNSGGIQETAMTPIVDGPSTLAATVPGPLAGTRHYGFRLLQGQDIEIMPVRVPEGYKALPEDLTRIATDPTGDELFGYANLDITDCHFSFSGDSLYGSITNAGGGFPVNQGLTFFGYLIGIADPALADPDTVFGLMYTFEQAGIISPGFYKITGPGANDLVKLGEVVIDVFPELQTIRLSCELAPMLSDPYFLSWYDPSDPVIEVASFTQRITILGGPAEADKSPGGRCYLRDLEMGPGANTLPDLIEFTVQGEGPAATAQIDYYDSDGHCPVVAEIVFDGTAVFPMYPATLDYTASVTYSTEPGIDPLADSSWTVAVLRFSDNLSDSVVYEAPTVGITDGGGTTGATALIASANPNPSHGSVSIEFMMGTPGDLNIHVWDVRGTLVNILDCGYVEAGPGLAVWSREDAGGRPVPPGVYFVRLETKSQARTVKIVLLD